MQAKKRRSRIIVSLTLVLATLCAVAVFLFTPRDVTATASLAHYRTAAALPITITSIGGSILFLGALRQFKMRMQIAYTLLSIGFILFGIALVQLPIIGFLNLWNSWYANSGMIIVPFIFSTGLIYAGIREFARLEGLHGKLTSAPFVLSITVLGVFVSFFAGHWFARYQYIEGTDLYIAIVAWSAINITFAAILARKIVGRMGPLYYKAMRWLFIALLVLTASAWHEYAISFFTNNDSWYVAYGLSFVPFIIAGLLIMRAGYEFALIGTTLPVIPLHEAPSQIDTSYAASLNSIALLVSNIQVSRQFTGQSTEVVQTEQLITSPQTPTTKANFVMRYRKLEHYLMHDEPLRTFERNELREKLSPEARAAVTERARDLPSS